MRLDILELLLVDVEGDGAVDSEQHDKWTAQMSKLVDKDKWLQEAIKDRIDKRDDGNGASYLMPLVLLKNEILYEVDTLDEIRAMADDHKDVA